MIEHGQSRYASTAWGQVLRGGFVDDLADAGAAGEENQIPLLREKGGRLWHRALDDRRSAQMEYCETNRAAAVEHAVAISDGFSTAVFSAANAATSGANNSMNGSFQALMIRVTPSGSRRTRTWPG